jgi:predicted transposase YdaD
MLTMFPVNDIRETRVYQEAKEEGRQEGLQEVITRAISRLAAKEMPAEEIASVLEVDIVLVHQVLNGRTEG